MDDDLDDVVCDYKHTHYRLALVLSGSLFYNNIIYSSFQRTAGCTPAAKQYRLIKVETIYISNNTEISLIMFSLKFLLTGKRWT